MKLRFALPLLTLTALLTQCAPKDTTFTITNDSVGKLQKASPVSEVETLFAADSIVRDTTSLGFGSQTSKIRIFEKGGAPLLVLTPNTDSIPTVDNIRIMDPRFKTEKGIGLNSTFKEISSQYTIKKITPALSNIIIFLKDSDLYFTMDKKELPANLRYSNAPIEAVQIPDAAKMKFMMVGWDH